MGQETKQTFFLILDGLIINYCDSKLNIFYRICENF